MKTFKQRFHQWSWLLLIGFILTGVFYPPIGLIAVLCMIAPVAVAFFNGRLWCGHFCPRGSFNDMLLAKWSRKHKLPQFVTTSWFRVTFLTAMLSAFTIQLALNWGHPAAIGIIFWRMVLITTLLTIFLGLYYPARTWCRVCPMGTLASYVANLKPLRNRVKQVTIQAEQCINCKVCNRSCPIAIDVHGAKETGRLTDSNCLKCEACVNKCPKKALHIA